MVVTQSDSFNDFLSTYSSLVSMMVDDYIYFTRFFRSETDTPQVVKVKQFFCLQFVQDNVVYSCSIQFGHHRIYEDSLMPTSRLEMDKFQFLLDNHLKAEKRITDHLDYHGCSFRVGYIVLPSVFPDPVFCVWDGLSGLYNDFSTLCLSGGGR